MINSKNFEKLIAAAQEFDIEIDRWGDFGLPIDDTPLYSIYWKAFDASINTLFTEEGVDWINWWLFERDEVINKCWDKDGNEIQSETIEDLWNLVKEYRK